jgi:hypothetical protein
MRHRRTILVAAGLAGALALGLIAPRGLVSASSERYRSDPRSYAVALQAEAATRGRAESLLGRLLLPASRVTVWVEPQRCPADSAVGVVPNQAYQARVQFYTLFAIPGPAAEIRCGGTQLRWATSREILLQWMPARRS